ncbi:MFS transporter [Alkalihalobacillus pseudalcaliphilus]|uniref:MFS transporter n=1 Tax=Alkalihalobacillus pseudalcaliphilus TaxID=79884 RepID=UPI00064DA10F|nr:MFS transporter [Alkalihalobacillus pseudalcaliphilus]KMK76751.1 hypothetical protein AB990_07495 [Alkalihalobacillus pseudalcaliphilus]
MVRNKKFMLLFSSTFFSSFGDAILFVILLTLLQQVGVGGIGTSVFLVCSALPVVLFGLHAGAFVENKNLQKIMMYSNLLRIITVFLFFIMSFYFIESLLLIFSFIFLITFINIFFSTASSTLIPNILSVEEIPKANGFFRMINMISKLIAYGFAALLFIFNLTDYSKILFASLFYLGSLILISRIKPYVEKKRDELTPRKSLSESTKEGLQYIKANNKIFRLFIVFGLGWIVGASIDVYLISYLHEIIGEGANSLYMVATPTFIGILIGSIVSPILYKKIDKKYGFLFSLFTFGVVIFCFSLELPFIVLQLLLVVGGLSQGILNIFMVSYLQTNVDRNYLARVFSVYNIIITAASVPGYLLIGLLIEKLGVINIGFVISSYLIAVGVICLIIIPSLNTEKELHLENSSA